MADFVNLDLPSDPEALRELIFETIQERWPDWEPADGNLETWIADAVARVTSEAIDLVQIAGQAIFKQFGLDIAQVVPDSELQATVTSTWTMTDDDGHTIEEGTEVGIPNDAGELIAFAVTDDVVVPPGSTVTSAGEVVLRAVLAGEDGNALDGTPELISAIDYVTTIALVGETSGGRDEESEEDYIERLVDEFQLFTPTPILAEEFAVLARRVDGVQRAVAVDGWDPSGNTLNNEKYVGLVLLDENGDDVDSAIKTAVEDYLESLREVNFVVEVGAPTVNTIDVTTTVRCYEGNDPTEVDAAVTAALTEFLSPTHWGVPPFGDPEADWINTTTLRYLEVAQVINAVDGVNYIESLTVEGAGVNVALTGTVPVVEPGTISVTANAGP